MVNVLSLKTAQILGFSGCIRKLIGWLNNDGVRKHNRRSAAILPAGTILELLIGFTNQIERE